MAILSKKAGRPKIADAKENITFRIRPDVISQLKKVGNKALFVESAIKEKLERDKP